MLINDYKVNMLFKYLLYIYIIFNHNITITNRKICKIINKNQFMQKVIAP